MRREDHISTLRFIEASRLTSPEGEQAPQDVRGAHDEPIGSLEGVVIDPRQWRVRFVVVKSPARRRYLLSTDCLATVDSAGHALRVDVSPTDLVECEEFEPSQVRQYSDEDLLGALFGRRIA